MRMIEFGGSRVFELPLFHEASPITGCAICLGISCEGLFLRLTARPIPVALSPKYSWLQRLFFFFDHNGVESGARSRALRSAGFNASLIGCGNKRFASRNIGPRFAC